MARANTPDTTACRSLSEALAKIGDKWTILIAMELEVGPKRDRLELEISADDARPIPPTLLVKARKWKLFAGAAG